MGPTLGLTLNEMLRDEQRLPKAGLLVIVMCLIAVDTCLKTVQLLC